MHETKKKERFSTLLGLTIFKDKNYLVLGATTFAFSAPFGASVVSVAFVDLAGAVEHPPEPQEDEEKLRSVNASFRIPSVIQLTRYDKVPTKKVHYCRKTIYKRDEYKCQYCGQKPSTEELSIDHVIPRSHGGLTTWENCVLACVKCNTKKANRNPLQANMKLLKIPKKPKMNALRCDYKIKDWESFLGVAYWIIELDNDNGEK